MATKPPKPPQPAARQPGAGGDLAAITRDDGPIIARIERQIIAKVQPQNRNDVERLVVAGMRIMFDPQTHQLVMRTLDQHQGDVPEAVADGVVQLLGVLKSSSKGPWPAVASLPALMVLACQALDFLDKTGMAKATPELVGATFENLLSMVMQRMQMTPDRVAQAKQAVASGTLPLRGPGGQPVGQPGGLLQRMRGG